MRKKKQEQKKQEQKKQEQEMREDECSRVIYTDNFSEKTLGTTIGKDLWLYVETLDENGNIVPTNEIPVTGRGLSEIISYVADNYDEEMSCFEDEYDAHPACHGYEIASLETGDSSIQRRGDEHWSVVQMAKGLNGKDVTIIQYPHGRGESGHEYEYILRTGVIENPGTLSPEDQSE